MKRLAFLAVVACLIDFGLVARPAQAGFIMTALEQNGNVVFTGSGTLDLTDLTSGGGATQNAQVIPVLGVILIGSSNVVVVDRYKGFTGPGSFGPGTGAPNPDNGSAALVGIDGEVPFLEVPSGYVSGNPLSDNATYDNQTFSSLGLTPGTYDFTWGTGAHADSFTVQIGPATTATPEPASLTLLGSGAAGLAGFCWRRRKRTA
jgi:hypothetical protein